MAIDFDQLVNRPLIAVFGEPAVVSRAGFDDIAVPGVFDSRYYALDDAGEVGGSTLVVTFTFRVIDLDPRPLGLTYLVPSDTTFTIRGTRYGMIDIRPDSEGMTVVQLERVDDDA